MLLDTNVYINLANGRAPAALIALLDGAVQYHCSVCLAEIAVGIGRSDPSHPNWPRLRDHYQGVLDRIPAGRVLQPAEQDWIDAGLIAGTLARTQDYQPHQHAALLNDALILLTAARTGLPVLTADRDYDLLQQLAPMARVLFY